MWRYSNRLYEITISVSKVIVPNKLIRRPQMPRGLRHRSAAARLLGLWVRNPPKGRVSVSCECCHVEVSATSYHTCREVLVAVVRYCV